MTPGKRGLVLVIDGDAGTRGVLSGFLRNVGYTTAEAATGAEALRKVTAGVSAAATVCDADSFVEGLPPPLLLLTASRTASRGTAQAALAKPFQLVDFGDSVLRLLKDHPRSPAVP